MTSLSIVYITRSNPITVCKVVKKLKTSGYEVFVIKSGRDIEVAVKDDDSELAHKLAMAAIWDD